MSWSLLAIALLGLLVWIVPVAWRWRSDSKGLSSADLIAAYDVESSGNTEAGLVALMKLHPKSALPAVRWAEWVFADQRWEEGLRRGEEVHARFPKDPGAFMVPVRALLELGRIEEAETRLRRATALFPNIEMCFFQYADIAARRGDMPEALRRWTAARQRFPNNVWSYRGEASTLVRMGDVAGAETLLNSALSTVDPATMAGIEIAYAEIAHNREDWPEAARRWAVARSHSDLDPILYLRGSESLRRAGDTAEADRLLDSALFLFPRHPEVAGVVAEREAATLQAGAAKPAA